MRGFLRACATPVVVVALLTVVLVYAVGAAVRATFGRG